MFNLPSPKENSFVNIQYHAPYQNCWLKPTFKLKQDGKQSLLNFKIIKPSDQVTAPILTRPTLIVDLVEEERIQNMVPPAEETVHFNVDGEESSGSNSSEGQKATKRMKLESEITRIAGTHTVSKNLHQPAGGGLFEKLIFAVNEKKIDTTTRL